VALAEIAAEFLIACLCVYWLFRTSFGRAVLIWLCSGVTNAVIAISLALTLRTMYAEAFVVPTGAMSPAIYGVHCYKDCDTCGYRLAVGVSYRLRHVPSETAVTTCTNCGQSVEILPSDVTIRGDRILVNKLAEPRRWDLVVFRPPDNPDTMYVKRLVGLPGEEVEIRDGDIFIDGRRQRKTPGTAAELWLPVNDTHFRPTTPLADTERCWRSQSDEPLWQWTEDQGWRFSGASGQHDELEFSGPVLDQLAYNAEVQRWLYAYGKEWRTVRDVKVACAISRFRGDGQFGINWRFGADTVTARVSAGGDVEIIHIIDEKSEEAEANANQARMQGYLSTPLTSSTVTFAFRDGMAYVMQDDRLVVSLTPHDSDTIAKGVKLEESRQIAIYAEDCRVVLQRIQLFRDVCYLSTEDFGHYGSAPPADPIQLGDQQYLVLGDNSRQSKDSRFFGPVAADSMKGVVECIYWPPERWQRFGTTSLKEGD